MITYVFTGAFVGIFYRTHIFLNILAENCIGSRLKEAGFSKD